MAQEVTVGGELTEQMIKAGEDLLKRLDASELNVAAALWFYLAEPQTWRLMLGTKEVGEYGPKKVYQKVQRVIKNAQDDDPQIFLKDIEVVDTNHKLLSLLSSAVDLSGDSQVRFRRNAINGQYIEDALIYRLAS